MKVTEWFTRTGPDTVNYKFTVEDPATFTAPFSGELPFNRIDELIYDTGATRATTPWRASSRANGRASGRRRRPSSRSDGASGPAHARALKAIDLDR